MTAVFAILYLMYEKTTHSLEKDLKKLERVGDDLGRRASHWRDSLASRYPIPFILLSTFGAVATFYGIEKIIDDTP